MTREERIKALNNKVLLIQHAEHKLRLTKETIDSILSMDKPLGVLDEKELESARETAGFWSRRIENLEKGGD